ncbi:MAG TPA: DUF1549 domain-containing protein [Schlesneria sp.]
MFACLIVAGLVIAAEVSHAQDVAAELSRRIDARLGVDAANDSQFVGNAEFLRRLSLDLVGRIPSIAEVHEFHDDTSQSRRSDLIRRMMQSGVYYRSMATFLRRSWVPQADTREFAAVTDGFELWLTNRLREGARYDDLVTEILTLDNSKAATAKLSPIGFYDANLSKPENLAASSTRAFLGLNLDCAQCHNHPFSRWTREQFWQTAAFFAQPTMGGDSQVKLPKVRVPDTELEYEPTLLTKAEIQVPQKLDSVSLRGVLVDWTKTDEERLLAKNAVNRLWAHFFGEAIIEPVDDISRDEYRTGEQALLLDEISTAFIKSGYNIDVVVQGIVGSNAYRLSTPTRPATSIAATREPGGGQTTPVVAETAPVRLATATVRGLTGEQMYDSLQTAAGLGAERKDVGGGAARSRRREFASLFYIERPIAAERSISQALTLMNGTLVNQLASAKGNPMLASVLKSPFMTFDEQIDTVFIAVLSRHASDAELQVVKQNFESHPDAAREQQLGNLFWVLVNSSEFNTNH